MQLSNIEPVHEPEHARVPEQTHEPEQARVPDPRQLVLACCSACEREQTR
jgi:hypothetical protein